MISETGIYFKIVGRRIAWFKDGMFVCYQKEGVGRMATFIQIHNAYNI